MVPILMICLTGLLGQPPVKHALCESLPRFAQNLSDEFTWFQVDGLVASHRQVANESRALTKRIAALRKELANLPATATVQARDDLLFQIDQFADQLDKEKELMLTLRKQIEALR